MQNKQEIQIGSVVQLKSGGPKMTVSDLFVGKTRDNRDVQMASCDYYVSVVKCTDVVPLTSLRIVE